MGKAVNDRLLQLAVSSRRKTMMHERRKHLEPVEEIDPKAASAIIEIQRDCRLRKGGSRYIMIVNANDGGFTSVVSSRLGPLESA